MVSRKYAKTTVQVSIFDDITFIQPMKLEWRQFRNKSLSAETETECELHPLFQNGSKWALIY